MSGDRNKSLSIKEYLVEIKPYLKIIIINLKKSGTQKAQLTITINFISFKDTDDEPVMHSNSDNTDIMVYDKEDELIKQLPKRYKIWLGTTVKDGNFIFVLKIS